MDLSIVILLLESRSCNSSWYEWILDGYSLEYRGVPRLACGSFSRHCCRCLWWHCCMNDRNSPSLMVHYLNKFKIKTKFGPKSRQLTV